MTPRETAEQIVSESSSLWPMPDTQSINTDRLTAAIESALLAERQRCALIADEFAKREMDESLVGGITTNGVTALKIATAIRSDEE